MKKLLLFLMILSVAMGATPPQANDKRPKICLALSGGGARGAAHIGVLKVLEAYRVPIDCVVGTSMGALVGGAYASGMSVEEMEKMVASLSTNVLFQDKPPREERTMRRKEEDYTLLFSPEMGTSGVEGSRLPKGMVSGIQLETVLRKLTVPGYRDFDALPIPYRAVATDLVSGKKVVFDRGEMANVMRSSMSVPVAIAPVDMNGQILVDGMLVDNLPIDEAKAMGADIVIAVNVGTPLLKRSELGTILGVAGQMLSILTEQNVQKSLSLLSPHDILITPQLGDFSTGDFDRLSDTLPIGEAAAREVASKLSALGLSAEQYALYRSELKAIDKNDQSMIDSIAFKKLEHVNPTYLESIMQTKAGEPIDQEVLNRDIRNLYGLGDFEHVGYQIVDQNESRTLVVDADEKSWGPDYFRFGLGLNSDFQGDSQFNILARLRKTWLNSYGAEWLSDIQIGSVNRLYTQWYQPVNQTQDFFIAPYAVFKQDTLRIFYDGNELALYDMDSYSIGLKGGFQIESFGELYAGIMAGELRTDLRTGDLRYDVTDPIVEQRAVYGGFNLDKLDSIAFPTAGWSAKGSVYHASERLGADDDYIKGRLEATYVQSYGDHTFNFYGLASGELDGELSDYDYVRWGGFLHQSGYQNEELLSKSLYFGRLIYTNKLLKYPLLDGMFGGLSLEIGKLENPLIMQNTSDVMLSGAAFLGTDSPLGPLYFGYGHAKNGEGSFYLFLGLPY